MQGPCSTSVRNPAYAITLVLVVFAGVALFLPGLGHTGLVDETPALFAASARRMTESGDWLVPKVNGLPRYDKPPLIYWLMAMLFSLPGHGQWDPLGTWAARIPSAVSTILTMGVLADTLLRWPPPAGSACRGIHRDQVFTACLGALGFALAPLVLVWGRTEVSDALFNATLALSLLLAWRTYAAEQGAWWPGWFALALAVLSKGPVALVLYSLVLLGFWLLGAEAHRLLRRLRPLRGGFLTLFVAAPWYLLTLWREGQAYGQSFFGYHNLQRYTRVVNNHHQVWWFYLALLVLASLPFTPLLLLSLWRVLRRARTPTAAAHSLGRFAAAWLMAVLLFFSFSATKLPSYWLVATPAAALLVALALHPGEDPNEEKTWPQRKERPRSIALMASSSLLVLLGAGLAGSRFWLPLIHDPTVPDLPGVLARDSTLSLGAALFLTAALLLAVGPSRQPLLRLLQGQAVLLLVGPLLLVPLWRIGDRLRGAPIRTLATVVSERRANGETLAMVGLMKPSLHYYSRLTVLYEGRSREALVNLADRLRWEQRPGLSPASADTQPTVLLVIDQETALLPHWQNRRGQQLARAGPYQLWRLDRRWLEGQALQLRAEGRRPTWRLPRPERF